MRALDRAAAALALAVWLTACTTAPPVRVSQSGAGDAAPAAGASEPSRSPIRQSKSRWLPVAWSDVPGWGGDDLSQAWPAWLQSCQARQPLPASVCDELRRLGGASVDERRAWVQQRFTPYRVHGLDDADASAPAPTGLLTAYYEPVLDASRQRQPGYTVPLHRAPAAVASKPAAPWFTRQEIDTLPAARAALTGREIAWLANPLDALILHIQGSGKLQVREPDGSVRTVRLAFGGTNNQPYKSVGRWLLDQGWIRDASWPGISQWVSQNPQRVREMLWANPRYVFFKEEALPPGAEAVGPRGAQGVPLSAGRSIAVDPGSIPYGSPVWLSTPGPTLALSRLVLAQDTGSAIQGAVRADFYMGSGAQAGEVAGRLKQPLQLWVLVPR